MKRTVLKVIAPAILIAPIALGFGADAPATLAPDTQAAWDSLKKLAGDWEGDAGGSKTSVVYRVTANGNTVMETLFPGTPHEMITMYHLDGAQLVMTHYCSAGNQPHLRLDTESSKPGYLVFSFAGGSNLDPQKDGHIHAGRIKLIDQDHVEGEWDSWENGRLGHTLKFVMTRKR